MPRTGYVWVFAALLWPLPACDAGEDDASRTRDVVNVPGLPPTDQGAPPAPMPPAVSTSTAGSGAPSSTDTTANGAAGAGGRTPEPAPVEPAPAEPAPGPEATPAEDMTQDGPPPEMDQEPPPAQGIFGGGGLFGQAVDAESFCDKYEMYCGFGGDRRHADRATCLQFYEDTPQQQACYNMHLDSAIAGTAAACNGEPSAFCFNIHCPHATGIDYCM